MEVTLLGYTSDGLIVAPVILFITVQIVILALFVTGINKAFDSK